MGAAVSREKKGQAAKVATQATPRATDKTRAWRAARVRWEKLDEVDKWEMDSIAAGHNNLPLLMKSVQKRGNQQGQRNSREYYERILISSCQRLRKANRITYKGQRWEFVKQQVVSLRTRPPLAKVLYDLRAVEPALAEGEDYRKFRELPPSPALLAVRQALAYLEE